MSKSLSSAFSGAVVGILAKIVDAILKFISIPLLIGFYGKADYGLIALAFSLNAYLRLMEMGMNTGAIRFYSIWFKRKEIEKIVNVTQSSITFYGCIGLINAILYLMLGIYGGNLFNVTTNQLNTFNWMMFILSASAIFQWISYVYVQLLTAREKFKVLSFINILRSALNFSVILVTINLEIPMRSYYFFFILSNLIIIPLYIKFAATEGLSCLKIIKPSWNYSMFREVLVYSITIFVMSMFQFTANEFRPILLGIFSVDGVVVLSDYRIIQSIATFVILIGGVFMQVLLPIASKGFDDKSLESNNSMAYEGTKYVSIILSIVVFGLILNSENLLKLYVGEEFSHLEMWLVIWLLTALLYLHNAPVASMVLATGKIRPLVLISSIGCCISLFITAVLAPVFAIGAAVMGYLVYIVLQMSFYYLFYIPKVLNLNSRKIFFKSFLAPSMGGLIACGIVYKLQSIWNMTNSYEEMLFSSGLFVILYLILISLFVLSYKEVKVILGKLR